MCLRCVFGPDSGASAQRAHAVALLALIELPDAIPADTALRLGQEILALIGGERAVRRCEPAAPDSATDASAAERRRP